MPCGVCIPCLVRRAALGSDEVQTTVNLASRHDPHNNNPVARVHLDACLDFARRLVDAAYSVEAFMSELPDVTMAALKAVPELAPAKVFELYRLFAREMLATFT